MNLYFDMEFTGLHKNTTIISIGIVSDNNKYFYAELTDYDKTQVDNWIKENVIDSLLSNNASIKFPYVRGDIGYIRNELLNWINNNFEGEYIKWVSDVCHYDFVLLVDMLYGNALNVPENHSPSCLDINTMIEDKVYSYKGNHREAFNTSRLELCDYPDKIKKTMEELQHNSLIDAIMMKRIYNNLLKK